MPRARFDSARPVVGTWVKQNPVPTDQRLSGVYFVDAFTGWVVGELGIVFKSVDGGATWTSQPSGSMSDLLAVHFLDASTGWAVGKIGTVLKSVDGGATWTPQQSGSRADLTGVQFVDTNTGWVVGGGIMRKTVDGGATWKPQTIDTSEGVYALHYVDANRGWAVGSRGLMAKTVDGGATWTIQVRPYDGAATFDNVFFVDDSFGYASGMKSGGYRTACRTTEGGADWRCDDTGGFLWFGDSVLHGP